MNIKLIIGIIVIVVLVGGWFAFSKNGARNPTTSVNETDIKKVNTFSNISSRDLYNLLSKKEKDFILINVHTPYIGEIMDTDKFIVYNNILDNLDKIPADKNTKIVLYCQSGGMSAVAAQTLVNLGYVNIKNLFGGMIDWKKNGYPLEYNNSRKKVH